MSKEGAPSIEAEHAFGCASCQALALQRQLDSLLGWSDVKEQGR